jgi:hypothetical protein
VEPIGSVAPDVVPAREWTPIAPPAPVTSWPGEREETDVSPEPDDYVEISGAPQRNWKPLAFGGVAVAALVAAVVLMVGGPETGSSSPGDLAAQPAASAPAVNPPPPTRNPTEAQALEAGLANIQQESEPLPAGFQENERGDGESSDPSRSGRGGTESKVSNGDTAREARLRISVPSLDNVTKSIEAAARARVDSLTEAKDKQVYEYKGKQPRQ